MIFISDIVPCWYAPLNRCGWGDHYLHHLYTHLRVDLNQCRAGWRADHDRRICLIVHRVGVIVIELVSHLFGIGIV